jgi:anti-sigma regulatory factor (Ser/Thr protein kinase)
MNALHPHPPGRTGVPQGEVRPHACLFYDRPGEQLPSVAAALGEAIASGERCVYLADESPIAEVAGALTSAGVDVRGACDRRALRLLTKGEFRPHEMVDFLGESVAETLTGGFTGLTVAGEMTWALGLAQGPAQLAAYEGLVNTLVATRRAAAICQYSVPRFSPSLVDEALRVHPIIQMPLAAESDIPALRRRGLAMADALGFTPGDLTLTWTVISELARNTVERGRRGELILRRIETDQRVGLRVNVRVKPVAPTADDLLPGLPEIRQRMDEVEVLPDAGGVAMMSITKWVR